MESQFYNFLSNKLRYKHLMLIDKINRHGNLNQAAISLSISQPAATRMLKDIEQSIGFELFKRKSRGMEATEVGIEIINFCKSSLGNLERCANNISYWKQGGFGLLEIGAIMGTAPDWLAYSISKLKSKYPLLKISLKGETSDQLIKLISKRQIDFAVGRFTDLQNHNWLDFFPIGNERLLIVVRKDHHLVKQKAITLNDLIDLPWVLQPFRTPTRQVLEKELEKNNLQSPKNIVECDSIFALIQIVQMTDAVTVLPEPVLRDYIKTGLLAVLPISLSKELSPFGIIQYKDEIVSPIGQEFIDILNEVSDTKK